MQKMKIALFAVAIMLLAQIASAATIHGTIYDDSLVQLNSIMLEIDSEPKQTLVSKDGSYSFTVPEGSYTLKAKYIEYGDVKLYAEEKVSVEKEGDFVIDLLLFPPLEDESIFDGEDINAGETGLEESKLRVIGAAAGVIILIAVSTAILIASRKKRSAAGIAKINPQEQGDELENLIRAIKSAGGRVTQKELRKQFPLSEAKVSLMIAELEHKGKVTKIKKGRGNIIILNR